MFLSKDKSVLVDGDFSLQEDLVESYYLVPVDLIDKVKANHPYYDFVLDSEGNLLDIMLTDRPPEPAPPPTPQEQITALTEDVEAIAVTAAYNLEDTAAIGETIANSLEDTTALAETLAMAMLEIESLKAEIAALKGE